MMLLPPNEIYAIQNDVVMMAVMVLILLHQVLQEHRARTAKTATTARTVVMEHLDYRGHQVISTTIQVVST